MKKIFFLLLFISAAFLMRAQFPVNSTLGNKNTTVLTRGIHAADSAFRWVTNYPDTATANLGGIKFVPGAAILVNSKILVRNATATGWVQQQEYSDSLRRSGLAVQMRKNGNWTTQFNLPDSAGGSSLTFTNGLTESGGVVQADTLLLATRAWRQKGDDSLAALIAALPTGANFGEADTLFSANRYVNQAGYTMSYKNGQSIFGADKKQIGTRYSYSWATNPLSGWSTSLTTATITTNGTKTNVSGGAYNQSNSFRPYIDSLAVNNWTITQDIVINQKDSTSYGLGFSFTSKGTGSSMYITFLLSSITGYIGATGSGAFPTGVFENSSSNYNFIWNIGDTVRLSILRNGRTVVASMVNLSNGSITKLNTSFPLQVSTPSIITWGGNYDFIGNFLIKYNDIQRPKIAVIGNSITYGYLVEEHEKWEYVAFNGVKGGWVDMSAPAERSIEGSFRIRDIIDWVKPDYLLVCYGINDRISGTTLDSFSKRIERIITYTKAANITPVIVSSFPYDAVVVTYNDTLQAIAARNSLIYIDVWTNLKNSSDNLDTKYNTNGDGIHPNYLGHIVSGTTIRNALKDILEYESPIKIPQIPTVEENIYSLGLDNDFNLVKALPQSDATHIRNIGSPTGLNIQRNANINISGSGWFSQSLSVGGIIPVQTGGQFSVNYNNNQSVYATNFATNGMYAGANAGVTFTKAVGGLITGTYPYVTFLDSVYLLSQNNFNIRRYAPTGAGQFSVGIDNVAGGNYSDYKILSLKYNGIEKANINRGGGFYSDSTSGYNSNINGLLGVNDFTTKGREDSIHATMGGGDMSIYTRQQDTITLASFGAGSGIVGDTTAFSTSTIYGSFFWDGSDTLVITKVKAVMNGGTSDTLGYNIYYNDTMNVVGSTFFIATEPVTSTTTGNEANTNNYINGSPPVKIPPGNWVWCKTPTVVTGRKPYYFSVSIIGYKKRVY